MMRFLIVFYTVFLMSCTKEKNDEMIYFLGDSHISRWDLNYYFPDTKHQNLGKGGLTISQLEDVIINLPNIKKCIVEIGTNDCLKYLKSNDPIDSAFSKIKQKYIDLFLILREKSEKCYILSLIPINKPEFATYINELQIRLNSFLDLEIRKHDNFVFINVYDKLKNSDGFINPNYTLDGIHLNKDGYDLISSILLKHV